MHKIDGAGHVNNGFVTEDLALNRAPTEITATWLNAVQEEISAVILNADISLDKNNNTQLYTALISMMGNHSDCAIYSQSGNISELDVGKLIFADAVSNSTLTLPRANSVRPGATYKFMGTITGVNTYFQPLAEDELIVNGGIGLTNITLGNGDVLTITSNGIDKWYVSGSSQLGFSDSFASMKTLNGHQRLPSGLIFQWVSGMSDANGLMQVNWPVAFPNAILGGVANERNPAGWDTIYGGSVATVWGFAEETTLTIARANMRVIINNQAPAKQANIAGKIIAWGY